MAGKKAKSIDIHEEHQGFQSGLFDGDKKTNFTKWFPPVYRDLEGFEKTLNEVEDGGELGLDFEFPTEGKNAYKATIIGISSLLSCSAVHATPDLVARVVTHCRAHNIRMVGHSVVGAERQVIKVTAGLDTELDEYFDTMVEHYLLNCDLCKAPEKDVDDDGGALGFLNLWTAVSLVLTVPCWKFCRGANCEHTICPTHDVRGYCAVDAWSSLAAHVIFEKELAQWNVPRKHYNELMLCADIAQRMETRGVHVDMEFVRGIEKLADAKKAELFSSLGFNPQSPIQVKAWFAERGIKLDANDKKTIRKALEVQAKKYGFVLKDSSGKFSLDALEKAEELPETLEALYNTYEFKSEGKGLKPWFGPKYIDAHDYAHPRFIPFGASTGRWSSSRPNFTNIPARGFGALVRAAIIPFDINNEDILHTDASNLELRMVMYLGGGSAEDIFGDADPFKWLVSVSGDAYKDAAAKANDSERGIAKTVSHASSYLEGIKVIKKHELKDKSTQKLIEAGALRVYPDWEYSGGLVSFTGSNLAERLFGDKSHKNRKRALDVMEDVYFKRLPVIRQWHRKVLLDLERNYDKSKGYTYLQCPGTGQFLRLYGSPEENAKMGTAALGQGCGARHMHGLLLRFSRETGRIPFMFVHDAFDFAVPRGWGMDDAKAFIGIMGEETDRFPGFKCRYKAFRGQMGLEFDEGKPKTHLPGAMVRFV